MCCDMSNEPLPASSYTREILQRLKKSAWEQRLVFTVSHNRYSCIAAPSNGAYCLLFGSPCDLPPSLPSLLPPSLLPTSRYVLGAVVLGQFLSLCLCGTGVTSELLVSRHDISVPTTQCFINYLFLALTFGVYFATRKKYMCSMCSSHM